MDKSLGTNLHSWGFFKSHMSISSPHPQTSLDACIQSNFRVSTLFKVRGGGGGVNCKVLTKRLNCVFYGTQKYCVTVPRTFLSRIIVTLSSMVL